MQANSAHLVRFAPLLIGLAIAGFLVARGCQEGPLGRSQLLLTTPEQELQLGRDAYRQILSGERGNVLPEDEAIVQTVRRVGERLRRASEDPALRERLKLSKNLKMEWEFNVIRSKQVNAFCLPGGKVAVYTGILPVCKDEAGLAVVMGHEIAHALARHGGERMSQQQVAGIVQAAVASSLTNMDPRQRAQVIGLLGAGAQVGVLLPFSREQESEADHIGIILMAAAGYDPAEASRFWMRMQQSTGSSGSSFLSTHPDHGTRIANLAKWAKEDAAEFYSRSNQQPDRFLPNPGRIDPARPKTPAGRQFK